MRDSFGGSDDGFGSKRNSAAAAPTTVKGYVIDSACTFTKHLKKPISKDCAIACAKAGSNLAIQTEEGTIYWPGFRLKRR